MRRFVTHSAFYLLWLLTTVGACVGSATVQAASFDCGVASTVIEHTICQQDALGALDSQLADRYEHARDSADSSQADVLLAEQRQWLKQRNACSKKTSQLPECLRDSMAHRIKALGEQIAQQDKAFTETVQLIQVDPAAAAVKLSDYRSAEASAWLLYLHQFEPASGVSDQQARARYAQVLARFNDEYTASMAADLGYEKPATRASATLTLLRLVLEERSNPESLRHCFIFKRIGWPAYDAFGGLWGSSRDNMAPYCSLPDDLFRRLAWQHLRQLFNTQMERISSSFGTIVFGTFADWRIDELHINLAPEDFIAIDKAGRSTSAAEPRIRNGDAKVWPVAEREAMLKAIAEVRQLTLTWLQEEKGMSVQNAELAMNHIVAIWLNQRLDFIEEWDLSEDASH